MSKPSHQKRPAEATDREPRLSGQPRDSGSAGSPLWDELIFATLRTALDGFCVTDGRGRILDVNQPYCELLGYTRDELLHMTVPDIEAVESSEETARHIAEIRTKGQDRFLTQHRRKDGAIVDVEVSIHYVPDRDGYFIGFVRDVSDYVQKERSLRSARDLLRREVSRQEEEAGLLRTAIEQLPVSVLLTDARGRIEYVNPAFTRITGYSAEEARGETPRRLWTSAQGGTFDEAPWEAMASGREWRGEIVSRRKDGSSFVQELVIAPVGDEGGHPTHFVGIGNDVTERRRAEDALRESTRLLAESQRVAALGSYRFDVASGTWTSSAMLDEIFGIAGTAVPRDVPGWLSIVHPEDRREMAAHLEEEVLGRHRRFDREYRIVRPSDGEERWVHGLGEIVADDDGRAIEMLGTIRDVTEEKRILRALRESEAERDQAKKLEVVGQLAGGVAHDFNNILTVILGNAEMTLPDIPSDHPSAGALRQIARTARGAAALTRKLLAFSQKQVLQPRVLDLNALVTGSVTTLRRVIGEEVALSTRLDPELWPVEADPRQLEQVLVNLAVNARDAMPDGGELSFETDNVEVEEIRPVRGDARMHPGRYVRLKATDTGHGMDEETRSRVFEPFFTTKERARGPGLGLSTVYGIVTQSAGHIRIDSEPGQGTTFEIYLPAVEGAPEPAREETAAGRGRGARTILLVEDEDLVLDVAVAMLEQAGYDVIAASNGADALRLVEERAEPIHLLLTDVVMPGMSGPALAERFRTLRTGVPVLYMSGYTDDALVRHGVLDPGVRLVEKPYSRSTLLSMVQTALASDGG